jgi:hypothetical protein
MEQLAGPVAFVAAHHLPGGAVHPRQPREPSAGKYGVHRGGRQPDQRRDPGRPELALLAQLDHRGLGFRIGAMRAPARPARAVEQPGQALGAVAVEPLVAGRPGHPELGDDVRDRALLIKDTRDQQQPAVWCQTGITVGHRDLRVWAERRQLTPRPEVSLSSSHHAVNNGHGHYI